MTLSPAYGRDYKSKAALLADFDADKDFEIRSLDGSGYVNKSQLTKPVSITFRYKKDTAVFIHKHVPAKSA